MPEFLIMKEPDSRDGFEPFFSAALLFIHYFISFLVRWERLSDSKNQSIWVTLLSSKRSTDPFGMQVEYFLLNAILPQPQLIFHPCNGLFLCGPSAGVSLEGLQREQVSLDTLHSPCKASFCGLSSWFKPFFPTLPPLFPQKDKYCLRSNRITWNPVQVSSKKIL